MKQNNGSLNKKRDCVADMSVGFEARFDAISMKFRSKLQIIEIEKYF